MSRHAMPRPPMVADVRHRRRETWQPVKIRTSIIVIAMLTLGIAAGATIATLNYQANGYLPPCATEDSTHCYWDASERGNGQGADFVSPTNGE